MNLLTDVVHCDLLSLLLRAIFSLYRHREFWVRCVCSQSFASTFVAEIVLQHENAFKMFSAVYADFLIARKYCLGHLIWKCLHSRNLNCFVETIPFDFEPRLSFLLFLVIPPVSLCLCEWLIRHKWKCVNIALTLTQNNQQIFLLILLCHYISR